MLNILWSVESDPLYNFHEQNETEELGQIVARALLRHSRSEWVKNTIAIRNFNDANFMKAIQKTCKQMFRDDALKEQIEWMKKATFLDTDPKEAIETTGN